MAVVRDRAALIPLVAVPEGQLNVDAAGDSNVTLPVAQGLGGQVDRHQRT